MAIQYFCDTCGEEMPKDRYESGARLRAKRGDMLVEVIVGASKEGKETWNTGLFCYSCVKDAVHYGTSLPDSPGA